MAGEWVSRKIGSLGRVVTGKTPSTTDPTNFGGNYPFITIPDLDGRVLIDRTARTLSERGADSMRRSLLPSGSVMMSCIATVGKCGITTRPSFTNQQINSVIPGTDVDSRLLYYVFTQLNHELESAGGGGSVYTNVSKSRFSDIDVVIPANLREQRTIAHILGTLDDKIELNRRMNETLEAMARAIFKSWFVDFDPVRAKMEGRQPVGMSAEIAALFPDAFEDSPLGKIPKGWRAGTVGDIGENIRKPVKPDEIPEETPYIGLEHIPRGSIALSDWGNAVDVTSNKSIFKIGQILFGKLRPYFHKVGVAPIDGVCSTDVVVISPKGEEWFGLLLGHLSSIDFINYTDAVSTGTKMPRTNWNDMSRYEIGIPSPDISAIFTERIFLPVVKKIHANIMETKTLSEIRDTLLPKLLSGELDVSDIDIELPEDDQDAAIGPPSDTTVPVPDNPVEPEEDDDEDDAPANERPVPVDEWETDEVMAMFRQAARHLGTVDRTELLRSVADAMDFQRLGPHIRKVLQGHLQAAVRRRIIDAEGQIVWLATPAMADYTRDELVRTIYSVTPRNQWQEREDIIRAAAEYLGFRRLHETVSGPIQKALRYLIREKVMEREGTQIRRTGYQNYNMARD